MFVYKIIEYHTIGNAFLNKLKLLSTKIDNYYKFLNLI